MSRDRLFLAALLLLVALPYVPGLSNGFVWLDHREIVEGELIAASLSEVPGLFLEDRNFQGYHRPIYNLLHSLDRALWGLDPFGFHLSSLVLHLVNVALVVALARAARLSNAAALALGGLWGLHPINTAVVGLIHAKADLASVTALAACVLCLLRGVRAEAGTSAAGPVAGPSTGPRASASASNVPAAGTSAGPRSGACVGAILAFVVALLTKELAFALPLGLGLAWLLGARPARTTAWAFWTVTATMSAIAAAVFLERLAEGSPYSAAVPLGERLLTFTTVYVDALRRTLVPVELTIGDTVTRFGALGRGAQVRVLATFAGLVGLQLWALRALPWSRPWILLFNLSFLPVAQIVPILHFKADRFLYLPTLGVLGLAVQAVDRASARAAVDHPGRRVPGRARVAAGALAVVLGAGYAWRDARRVRVFADDLTLFAAELERTPDYVEGLTALARALDRRGRHAEAAPLWERTLIVDDARIGYRNLDVIVVNRSHNLLALGRHAEAAEFLHQYGGRVRAGTAGDRVDFNLALATYRLERYAEALPLFARYAAGHPADERSRLLLGACAIAVGDTTAARAALEAYLELAPVAAPDRATARAWLEDL